LPHSCASERRCGREPRPTPTLAEKCVALRSRLRRRSRELHHPGGSSGENLVGRAVRRAHRHCPRQGDCNLDRAGNAPPARERCVSTATPCLARTSCRRRTQSHYPSPIAMSQSPPACARTASRPTQNCSARCCSGCGQFFLMRTE
jgi:hypothetical protein